MKEKELVLNRQVVRSITPPPPANMLVALNNICNHKCVFCAYRKALRKPVSINKDFLFDIMKQAYRLGTREIGLYSTAEPFTYHELEDVVAKASEIGFEYIYLTTNGSLATVGRIEKLIQNGLNSIKFSINASDRDSYKKIHGRDDFDKVITNVKLTGELREKHKRDIGIFVSFIECSLNKNQFPMLKKILSPFVDNFYCVGAINQAGHMFEEVCNKIVALNEKKSCDMIFNRFHITPEGYLTACCGDFDNMLVVADLNNVDFGSWIPSARTFETSLTENGNHTHGDGTS